MANYEETRYDFDGANLTDVQGLNTGIVIPWSSASTPSGFLECDGTAVSRTTYSALFAVVGTTYGIGDGSTTFNIPDLTDRCCINTSPTKALASTGGANTATVTGNASGATGSTTIVTPTLASHTHVSGSGQVGPIGMGYVPYTNSVQYYQTTGSAGGGSSHSHPFSSGFAGDSKTVLQPYLTIIYIIKT